MNSDLLRQRRNLILVSLALLVVEFSNITIEKISILGTELAVKNPNGIMFFAWTLWGYFLIRYYQYLMAEPDLQLVSSIAARFNGKAIQYAFKEINRESIQGQIEVSRMGLVWKYSVMEYEPSLGRSLETTSGILPKSLVVRWLAESCLHVFVHTTKFTDHVLPAVLALIVPIVYTWNYLAARLHFGYIHF